MFNDRLKQVTSGENRTNSAPLVLLVKKLLTEFPCDCTDAERPNEVATEEQWEKSMI